MITNMQLSDDGRELIKQNIKLYLNAYINEKRVPAIGYGITRYPDNLLETHGGNVKIGDRISKYEADVLFDSQMILYEECVNNFVKVPITQKQFDALVYYCYKMGIENFLMHPGLIMLNNFEYRDAILEFKNKPKIKADRTTLSSDDLNIMDSIYKVFLT